ncbi:unnamed protein product [Brassica rapa subsp. narinosa]
MNIGTGYRFEQHSKHKKKLRFSNLFPPLNPHALSFFLPDHKSLQS